MTCGARTGRRCERRPERYRAKLPRLKNGHPAHVFTDEDRRKAAHVTNEIRREKRALLEQLRLNEEIERMLARDAARRERRNCQKGGYARAAKLRTRRELVEQMKLEAMVNGPTPRRRRRRSHAEHAGPGELYVPYGSRRWLPTGRAQVARRRGGVHH